LLFNTFQISKHFHIFDPYNQWRVRAYIIIPILQTRKVDLRKVKQLVKKITQLISRWNPYSYLLTLFHYASCLASSRPKKLVIELFSPELGGRGTQSWPKHVSKCKNGEKRTFQFPFHLPKFNLQILYSHGCLMCANPIGGLESSLSTIFLPLLWPAMDLNSHHLGSLLWLMNWTSPHRPVSLSVVFEMLHQKYTGDTLKYHFPVITPDPWNHIVWEMFKNLYF
jgi:hypothetical protein